MSSDIVSLHKILKDETRRKIILLLNKNVSIGYTEIMDNIGIVSTGTLNYHLKVLGDLVEKNETGQYMLSKKGQTASRLLIEFPQRDYSLEDKKKWWRRFWIIAVALDAGALILALTLNLLGYLSSIHLIQSMFGFIGGIVFLYFFYRMVRPTARTINNAQSIEKATPDRTIQDILVTGRTPQEVKARIQHWIAEEGIILEAEYEGFFRGRLGIPSGLGLTAPKYFEVSFKAEQNGVSVHTEGWVSVYDIREASFSKELWVMGNIPRRKGWKVIEHLWAELRAMSQ